MMNNEEFNRRMEFFLHQQAQFFADMQQMKEVQKELQGGHKELQDGQKELQQGLAELRTLTHEGFKQTIRRFDAVARSFKVIAEIGRETDARIRALVGAQTQTDEKIGRPTPNLIAT